MWKAPPVRLKVVRIHIINNKGQEHRYMAMLAFETTNNETKYEALVVGLSVAETLRVTEVEVKSDSHVTVKVNQVLGTYATKGENLKKYLTRVLRGDNVVVDRLVRTTLGMEDTLLPWEVEKRIIEVPTIGPEFCTIGSNDPVWVVMSSGT